MKFEKPTESYLFLLLAITVFFSSILFQSYKKILIIISCLLIVIFNYFHLNIYIRRGFNPKQTGSSYYTLSIISNYLLVFFSLYFIYILLKSLYSM